MIKYIQDLLGGVSEDVALAVLIGAAAVLLLLIILIIVLIVSSNKKKKAKKAISNLTKENDALKTKISDSKKEETKVEKVEVKKEEPKVEEVKKEEPKVEEVKKVEPKVEETKKEEKVDPKLFNETKIEVKTPVVEEVKKEEPKVEEKVEEVKTSRIVLGKYEVFPVNDVFMYRLKASNGEVLVVSEMYKTVKSALSAIETVKKNIEKGSLQIYQDKHNLWQFKLLAVNKRLLVASANYDSQAHCESAAESFKKFALISPSVVLEDDPDHLMEEIVLEACEDKRGGKIVCEAIDGIYEFKLLASNGVVLCSSMEYSTKAGMESGISSFKEAVKTGRFYVIKDKRNMYQFKLYSTLGRCVVIGEAYKNKPQAMSAANSVAGFINMAEIKK